MSPLAWVCGEWSEDRGPRDAMFSMMMFETMPHADAYTFSEYEQMFRDAGFERSEMRELSPTPQRVIVSYK